MSTIAEERLAELQAIDGLTVEELDALPEGARVADAEGDLWQMQDDGKWTHQDGRMTSATLEYVWGPIRLVQEPLL